MTNLEKMNELVGTNTTKEQIANWAYANRIYVLELHHEEEFKTMEKSVNNYLNSYLYAESEHDNWDKFLGNEFIA
jgi:hypothetical protein